MKRRYKIAIIVAIALPSILFTYSFFHIKGSDIYGAADISQTSSITLTKSYHLIENEQDYVLGAKQTELLKTLIVESDFTRNLSSYVRFYDKDMYVIKIDFNNSRDSLYIHCIGNEYISIANQFNGNHLRINNPDWKNALEEIISFSK